MQREIRLRRIIPRLGNVRPENGTNISTQLLAGRSSRLLRFALAETRLLALLLRFPRFAFRLFVYGKGRINPLQIGDRSGIALALAELDNPCVTAIAISCPWRDLVE